VFDQIDFSKRKAKIVCTIGPATATIEDIVKLIDAGMTTARINLSHGAIKDNLKLVRQYKAAKRLRPHRTCAVMLECRGREIRMSNFKDGQVRVRSGSTVNMFGGEFHLNSDNQNFRISNDTVQRHLK